MIFETRFGTLNLPKDECVECIASGFYTTCSYCDYRWGLKEDATPVALERRETIQKWIDEHPGCVEYPGEGEE